MGLRRRERRGGEAELITAYIAVGEGQCRSDYAGSSGIARQ